MPREFLTFLVVGAAATLTHIMVAIALEAWFGLSAQRANLGGYLCAVGVSYFGHTKLTFRVNANHKTQFSKFVLVSLFGFAISTALVAILAERQALPFAYVMFVVGMVVAPTTFFLSKFWAFAETKLGQPS